MMMCCAVATVVFAEGLGRVSPSLDPHPIREGVSLSLDPHPIREGVSLSQIRSSGACGAFSKNYVSLHGIINNLRMADMSKSYWIQ